jgi:hypothetical protein
MNNRRSSSLVTRGRESNVGPASASPAPVDGTEALLLAVLTAREKKHHELFYKAVEAEKRVNSYRHFLENANEAGASVIESTRREYMNAKALHDSIQSQVETERRQKEELIGQLSRQINRVGHSAANTSSIDQELRDQSHRIAALEKGNQDLQTLVAKRARNDESWEAICEAPTRAIEITLDRIDQLKEDSDTKLSKKEVTGEQFAHLLQQIMAPLIRTEIEAFHTAVSAREATMSQSVQSILKQQQEYQKALDLINDKYISVEHNTSNGDFEGRQKRQNLLLAAHVKAIAEDQEALLKRQEEQELSMLILQKKSRLSDKDDSISERAHNMNSHSAILEEQRLELAEIKAQQLFLRGTCMKILEATGSLQKSLADLRDPRVREIVNILGRLKESILFLDNAASNS